MAVKPDNTPYPTRNPDDMGSMGPLPPPPPYPAIEGFYPTLPTQRAEDYGAPPDHGQPMVLPMATHRPFINIGPMAASDKDQGINANPFKYAAVVRRIALFMILPSVIIIGVGVAVAILAFHSHLINDMIRPSTSIWIGVLGFLAAMAGVRASGAISTGRRTTISYFVLLICMAICDGSLLLLATQCVMRATQQLHLFNMIARQDPLFAKDHDMHIYVVIASLEGTIAISAMVHMVCSIVNSALICGLWCNNTHSSPVTVIYIHPETVSTVRRLAAVAPCQQNQVYFVATPVAPTAPKFGGFQAT